MSPEIRFPLGRVVKAESNRRAMYRTQSFLGSGCSGRVYMVKRIQDHRGIQDHHIFAMKVIGTSASNSESHSTIREPGAHCIQERREAMFAEIKEEATFLMHHKNANIIELEDFAVDIEFANPEIYCCLVMEHAAAGSLFEFYQHIPFQFKEDAAQAVAYQMLQALNFLHSQRPHAIAHRDIKPGNILVFGHDSNHVTFKLADFGLATLLYEGVNLRRAGTYTYMAPEVVNDLQRADLAVRADIYSLGRVLGDMLRGTIYGDQGVVSANAMSVEATHVTNSMLDPNPSNRATANGLLRNNRWVKAGAHVPRYSMPHSRGFVVQHDDLSQAMSSLQL